jgi:hypothetical protein
MGVGKWEMGYIGFAINTERLAFDYGGKLFLYTPR